MSNNSTDLDISLEIILPVTIGAVALCAVSGAMYYYCSNKPTVTSLDGVDFCYAKFGEEFS
ncbi:MAG: hypothetical protein N4A31_01335 [Rickettsiales bacterium]|jgi:hypothetical protein|nr:hypothetical protein [Rickettsiales bacterium]